MAEKRLIVADTLLETIHDTADGLADCDQQNAAWALRKYAARDIMDAPTVDAVEVVRCRDCKFFEADFSDDGVAFGRCVVDYPDIEFAERLGYDFCSYGERRTDG